MAIDPNAYKDGIPLGTRSIMDRIAADLETSGALEAEYETLKANAKAKKKKSDAIVQGVRELSALHRLGRPVFELVDGTLTSEAPKSLPLWDAVEKARARNIEAEKTSAIVGIVYAKYGEGRAEGVAFDRKLFGGVVAHVQSEAPGEWRAKVGNEPVPNAPWRSAADAMLAALAFSKDLLAANAPEVDWTAGVVVPTETPKDEIDVENVVDDAPSAPPRKSKTPAAEAPKPTEPERVWPACEDDGHVYRSVHDRKGLAVSQAAIPGPWFGYIGTEKVALAAGTGVVVNEFATSGGAKHAVSVTLGGEKEAVALTWAARLPDGSTKEEPTVEAPKRRTRAK